MVEFIWPHCMMPNHPKNGFYSESHRHLGDAVHGLIGLSLLQVSSGKSCTLCQFGMITAMLRRHSN